jgi:hypothetical protein
VFSPQDGLTAGQGDNKSVPGQIAVEMNQTGIEPAIDVPTAAAGHLWSRTHLRFAVNAADSHTG